MKIRYILGLNAYHGDSSACIYRNGVLIAASEEERFRRIKHWAGLPTEAVDFCLKEAGIPLTRVDAITVSRDPYAKLAAKAIYALKNLVSVSAIADRLKNTFNIKTLKKDLAESFGLNELDVKAKIHFIEHHRSHMASAFMVSPFEEAAILSIDGMGDFSSVMKGVGKKNKIKVFNSTSYPHSLGIFYTTFTQYMGFPNYGDEYKVMGLAPYGQPVYTDQVWKVINKKPNGQFALDGRYFRHFSKGVSMSWDGGAPKIESLFTNDLDELIGLSRSKSDKLDQRHMDLAASVQKVTEQLIFHMAEDLQKKTGLKSLCIAGGVAQNSVANGKVIENTSFERLYVPSAGHDAGTSVGSALYLFHHLQNNPRKDFANQAYTGVEFTNDQIKDYLKRRNIPFEYVEDERLFPIITERLINAGVVGWFQGKAEFGPRALGNRSIIVDPRRRDAKELLNAKIKKRESFRPFAPSILKEYTGEFFERDDDVPFMEKVYTIKKDKRAVIPAVTHVDGTGRLQTVDEKDAPRYHRLINTFYEKTGVPVLLNTSFNENEPIVNTPEHALECFLRTKMDMLVMENIVVSRN